jgi:hypothetical protein
MIYELEELLNLLNDKHPNENHDGFVKILIYSDGSGRIYDGPVTQDDEHELFEFSNPGELVEYLRRPNIEPEHLEE